jgi:hypothetical protein
MTMDPEKQQMLVKLVGLVTYTTDPDRADGRSTPELVSAMVACAADFIRDLKELTARLSLVDIPEDLDRIFKRFARLDTSCTLGAETTVPSHAADRIKAIVRTCAEEKQLLDTLCETLEIYWRTRN